MPHSFVEGTITAVCLLKFRDDGEGIYKHVPCSLIIYLGVSQVPKQTA